ncbi:hypothetical protein B4V02_22620 [Paenibacillus kribbensis]|uniref:Uncharacterized protein n=1 Tax=Paenibacillus kribbensis TaxID=172713 RepID=A0A222WRY2_9BACL|nr:hypothetical protein B4V02_22620 [Paenibacillus kribbensis]
MKKLLIFIWFMVFVIFLKLINLFNEYSQNQMSITFKYQPYLTYQWILYFLLGIYFSLIFTGSLRFVFKKNIFIFAFIPSLLVIIYYLAVNYLSSNLNLIFMLSGFLLSYSLLGEKK